MSKPNTFGSGLDQDKLTPGTASSTKNLSSYWATDTEKLYVENSDRTAWVEVPLTGGGATALSQLSDVQILLPPTGGQVLAYDSDLDFWHPATISGGGASTLDGLTDVEVLATPSDGQALIYDSINSIWKPQTLTSLYVLPFGFTTTPTSDETLLLHVFPEAVTFSDDWAGSRYYVGINPTSSFVMTILKNGSSVGTVTISTAGVATFVTTGTTVSFAAGDIFAITGPNTADATVGNVAISFSGIRLSSGTPSSSENPLIGTTTASGSSSVLSVSGIPANYDHLKVYVIGRSTASSESSVIGRVTFNNDTGTNYEFNRWNRFGSGDSGAANYIEMINVPNSAATAGFADSGIFEISNYADTAFSRAALGSTAVRDSGNRIPMMTSGWWNNTTSPITSIEVTLSSGNWAAGSKIWIYGVGGITSPSSTSSVPTSFSGSHTLALVNAEGYLRFTNSSAATITVPPNSSQAFVVGTIITIEGAGTGTLTFSPGAGVTLNSRDSALSLTGQYSVVQLKKIDTDVWTIIGDVS